MLAGGGVCPSFTFPQASNQAKNTINIILPKRESKIKLEEDNTMWDMKNRVETQFLNNFDGEVIKAGFMEGFISAEKTRSGQAVVSHQLFLLWKVLSEEANDQPAWYSMGGKAFVFGGKVEKVAVGDKELEIYELVTEGPELNVNSRMGQLLERLQEKGFVPEGDSARAFTGLKCHLVREKYESKGRSTLEVERETLMPTAVLGKGAPTAPAAAAAEEAEEILASVIVGKGEKDVADLSKTDRIKAVGLTPAKIFKLLDKMVAEGKLVKDKDGNYQEA